MQPSFFNHPCIFVSLTPHRICVAISFLVIEAIYILRESPSDSNNLNLGTPEKLNLEEFLQMVLLLCNQHQSSTVCIISSQVDSELTVSLWTTVKY